MKKFHVKIFSSSWIKSSYLLPYFFNGTYISCVQFSSQQAADEIFFNSELFPNYGSMYSVQCNFLME